MEQKTRPPAEFVPIDSIVIPPGRIRKEFDPEALAGLGNSIRAHGLFHALQVRSDGVTLVSGETRLRILRDPIKGIGNSYTYGGESVPPGHVPVIRVSSEDPLVLEEIELEENTQRKDLTWQEIATTTKKWAELRQKQAAQAAEVSGAPTPAPVTHMTLAEELRGTPTRGAMAAVRQELIVARHLDDPEVAGAKTISDAMKIVKKKDQTRQMLALGELVGKTFSHSMHQHFNENCLQLMQKWIADPNGPRFDVILTDPPYGMGAHEFGDGAGRLANIEHHYDDSYESWKLLMEGGNMGSPGWCELSYAVAKSEAHAYVFCDFDRFHELKGYMQAAGWYVFRTPLINVKRNSGRVPLPDQGPRRQYEICLYAIKGKKKVNSIQSDIITTEADEQMSHGAQKPVELYDNLLRRSVKPGDMVLDSFAGSGTIFPACHELQCIAYGIEQSPSYYGMGLTRLQALGAQGELSV